MEGNEQTNQNVSKSRKPLKISLNRYAVLVALLESDSKLVFLRDIAEKTCLNRSSVARVVRELENEGILSSYIVYINRRGSKAIIVTDKLLEKIQQIVSEYEKLFKELGLENPREEILKALCNKTAKSNMERLLNAMVATREQEGEEK